MTIKINDPNSTALFDASGAAFDPFTGVSVDDTAALSATETVTVTLSDTGFLQDTAGLGTLFDPVANVTSVSGVLTEKGLVGGVPTFATNLLKRLVYTAPGLAASTSYDIKATITVTNGIDTQSDTLTQIDLVTPPAIGHTTPNQPVASGAAVRPFSTITIGDEDFDNNATDTATIRITDGGIATDADGLLTGSGVSKTGVGTYTIAGYNPFNLQSLLQGLTFTTATLQSGQVVKPQFEIDVADPKAGLTTSDLTTSLNIMGPVAGPTAPSIAGTQANQTVTPGNFIDPFHAVSVSDANTGAPMDSVMITVTDANGTATDADGSFAAAAGLTHTGTGTYTLAGATPAMITTELDQLAFVPAALAAGQTSLTTNFKLVVTNVANGLSAPDPTPNTSVVEQPMTSSSSGNNFQVVDETTGQAYQSPGMPYPGPVAGISNEIIFATTDNINVNALTPNVFIHSGSGQDGLTALSGTNILDGSTNSNFLTGATGTGHDTFYLDDRSPAAPIFSTIVNFHSGDDVTVFGVTQADFSLVTLDNQGASGFTGLDLLYHKAGQPDVSFVLAGYTSADLTNGKTSMVYSTEADGTPFMTLHAT